MYTRALADEQRVHYQSGLPSSEDLLTVSSLLDKRASPNLWDYTAWIDGNVSAVLSSKAFRINLDIFRGYGSEEELVEIASNRQEQARLGIRFVLAGIVFQVAILQHTSVDSAFKLTCLYRIFPPTLRRCRHRSATRYGHTATLS